MHLLLAKNSRPWWEMRGLEIGKTGVFFLAVSEISCGQVINFSVPFPHH